MNKLFQTPLKIDVPIIEHKIKKNYRVTWAANNKILNMATDEEKARKEFERSVKREELLHRDIYNINKKTTENLWSQVDAYRDIHGEASLTARVMEDALEHNLKWKETISDMIPTFGKLLGFSRNMSNTQKEILKIDKAIFQASKVGATTEEQTLKKAKEILKTQDRIEKTTKAVVTGFKAVAAAAGLIASALTSGASILVGMVTGPLKAMDDAFGGIFSNLMSIVTNPLTLFTTLVGLAVDRVMEVNKATVDLRRNLGINNKEAQKLVGFAKDLEHEFAGMGMGLEESTQFIGIMAQTMGRIHLLNKGNIEYVAKMSKYYGMSEDESAKLYENMYNITGRSDEAAQNMGNMAIEAAKLLGIPVKDMMSDISGISSDVLGFMAGYPKKIIRTTAEMRRLGLSINDASKVARGMLDVQSSISAEMEASVMTGKSLNFNAARQFALQGDLKGVMDEVLGQLGSIEEFQSMNILQKEAIAKATGLDISQLNKALGIMSKEDLAEQKRLENLDALVASGMEFSDTLKQVQSYGEKIKQFMHDIGIIFSRVFGPEVESVLKGMTGIDGLFTSIKAAANIIVDKFLIPTKDLLKEIVFDIFGTLFGDVNFKDSPFSVEGLTKLGEQWNTSVLPAIREVYFGTVKPMIEDFVKWTKDEENGLPKIIKSFKEDWVPAIDKIYKIAKVVVDVFKVLWDIVAPMAEAIKFIFESSFFAPMKMGLGAIGDIFSGDSLEEIGKRQQQRQMEVNQQLSESFRDVGKSTQSHWFGMDNTKKSTGGILNGPSHAAGGIPVIAEGGEAIINKRSTAMFAPQLSAMNQAGGGVSFAGKGGLFYEKGGVVISDIVGAAQRGGDTHPPVLAAQWALESAYGKSQSGKFNYFGIKGQPGTSRKTWEVVNGKKISTTATFRDYSSLDEGIKARIDLMNKPRYSGYRSATSTDLAIDALVKAGYATDPKYGDKLRGIIKANSLDTVKGTSFTGTMISPSGELININTTKEGDKPFGGFFSYDSTSMPKNIENKGVVGGSLEKALDWARQQAGKPYKWAQVGPEGYDCSGFMSAVTNVVHNQPPYSRLFSTSTFAGGTGAAGFKPGTGAFTIGVKQGNPGHMAGTINGVNVESRGSKGVLVGPEARGAMDKLFTNQYYLSAGKGMVVKPPVNDAFIDSSGVVTPINSEDNAVLAKKDGPIMMANKTVIELLSRIASATEQGKTIMMDGRKLNREIADNAQNQYMI